MAGTDDLRSEAHDLHPLGIALIDVLMVANDPRLWHEMGVLIEKGRIAARARLQLAELGRDAHEGGRSHEQSPGAR